MTSVPMGEAIHIQCACVHYVVLCVCADMVCAGEELWSVLAAASMPVCLLSACAPLLLQQQLDQSGLTCVVNLHLAARLCAGCLPLPSAADALFAVCCPSLRR